MLDFICIMLIIFEVIFTIFCVKKICKIEVRVDEIHVQMLEGAKKVLEINDEIRKVLKKVNKVVRIITNKRLHQIKSAIMLIMDIVQVILLFKSLNLSNGAKSFDYKLLKNIAFARVGQQIIRKVLDSIQNLCAI